MAKNFVQNGKSIQLLAAAIIVGGSIVQQGSIVGVAEHDAAVGDQVTVTLKGVFDTLPKKAGEAWAQGDKLYYDSAGPYLCKDNTKEFAGYAYAAALSADVTGAILLKH